MSFSNKELKEKKNCELSTRIKDPVTSNAWHSRADNATFMEHSFRRPLTPPTIGWKLKGASRAPLSSPAAAVRRRRFRIVLIIVRRPPRGGETVSRGWRPRPWPWCGSAGWRFIERQDFHCSPHPHSLFSLSPSGAATTTVAAVTPAVPSHPIHATFSPTQVITLSSYPTLFSWLVPCFWPTIWRWVV